MSGESTEKLRVGNPKSKNERTNGRIPVLILDSGDRWSLSFLSFCYASYKL